MTKPTPPGQVPQQPCPTCAALARTVMLDQVSFDRKPDCYGIRQITDDESVEAWEDIRTSPDVAREEANDMMATGRGEIYEVVPLWTTPRPAPATQQAVGNSGFDYKTAADFLSGKTVSDEALRKFVAASRGAHDDRAALRAQMLSLRGVLASREAEIALLKRSLLDAEAAAPQPSPAAQAAESVPAPQPAAHQGDGVPTWQAAQDPMLECSVQPRPLSHPLTAYHSAMSKGPLHYTWQDKPHRLVYDLIAAVKHYANQAGQAAPAAQGDALDAARLEFAMSHGLPMERDGLFRYHGFAEQGWHTSKLAAIDAAMADKGAPT